MYVYHMFTRVFNIKFTLLTLTCTRTNKEKCLNNSREQIYLRSASLLSTRVAGH